MASISLLTGALYQKPKGSHSLPIQTFSQAHTEDFVGESKCAECHASIVQDFPQSYHAIYVHGNLQTKDKQDCEACHGPGRAHAEAGDGSHIISFAAISNKEVIDACLRCHGDLMKKPHFQSEAHARAGLSCINCHQIHPHEVDLNLKDRNIVKKQVFAATKDSHPLLKADEATLCGECHKPELAAFRKNSHHPIPEGRMTCSDCHSIHPTNADKLKSSSLKDNCVTCHADIAGPFVYEHDPVAGWTGAGCVECHDPHGTHNPTLLKSFSRGLCLQCHTDKGGTNHFPGQSCWNAGCHVAIHGSNHDPKLLSR